MSYLETVANTVDIRALPIPTSRGVVEHALSLRNSTEMLEASSAAHGSLELSCLSKEDQNLFQTRIFGGSATKFALASYYSEAPSLYSLSVDDQLKELEELSNRYAAHNLGDPHVLLQATPRQGTLTHIPNGLVRSWVFNTRRAKTSNLERLKAIESYINVIPGTFPPSPYYIKPMGENDVTLVQAFGRDTITDSELITVRGTREQLEDDDMMMLHLDDIEFKPGPSNIDLAEKVADLLQSDTPPEQVLQWEVAYALYQQHPAVYKRYRNYIHTLWPHNGFYPTYEVKQDSVEVMDQFGLYNAQELAHPDMMARAVAILEKLGVQPDPLSADIRYDPGSTQPHVHSAGAFIGREVLARIEHILRGRVSF